MASGRNECRISASMHGLTLLFLIALGAGAAVRLWLARRQIAAARTHRERVPEPFADAVSLADHQKAADYTVARKQLSSAEVVFDAVLLVALTIGGGLAAIDAAWRQADLPRPWHGT